MLFKRCFMTTPPKIIMTVSIAALESRLNAACSKADAERWPAAGTPSSETTPGEGNAAGGSGALESSAFGEDETEESRGDEDEFSAGHEDGELANAHEDPVIPPLITEHAALYAIAEEIAIADAPVALDIETYHADRKSGALNPFDPCGNIRLLALCLPAREPWLLDLRALGYDLGPVAGVLETAEVVGQNLKFDLLWLRVKCGIKIQKAFCTMTASRLLTAGSKEPNDLATIVQRHLGIKLPKDQGRSDWGGLFLSPEQLAYSGDDVRHLHSLRAKLEAELKAAALTQVAALEMELLPAVVAMEEAGIAVDQLRLQSIRDSARDAAQMAGDRVRELLSSPALNPGSTDQIKAAMGRAGIVVANTKEETLKAADDGRIIPAILEMRAAEKSAQQAETLLGCIAHDGRIHGRFEPTGTDTGRFACKSPNLQNIGRGSLRECFIAPKGMSLVVADYSQIELRAAAVIAGETKMIEAYQRGEDLHRLTAATVLGKNVADVTKEERQIGKPANFGLLYGQSAKGLVRYAASSYGVTMSEEQAYSIRGAFFRTYGSIRQWHGESRIKAERGVAEVRTVLGRRRLIPSDADGWERFTALVNTPVQGGCADVMKKAILLVAKRLPQGTRVISTVHDELIIETPEDVASETLTTVQTAMIEAMVALFPAVPVEVEAKVCKSWGEK